MSYSQGPYANEPAPELTTTLHSSRKVNFATKRYEHDANGNPLGMSSIQQTVALKLAWIEDFPPVNTPQGRTEMEDLARAALADLQGDRPLIDSLTVEYVAGVAGTMTGQVSFRDITTDTNQTVQF